MSREHALRSDHVRAAHRLALPGGDPRPVAVRRPVVVIDPLDPAYRWCVYCGADCWPEPEAQRHHRDCPVRTGLYPVRAAEIGPYGFRCCRCPVVLAVGDCYVLIGSEAVCVGCGTAVIM